MTEFLEDDKRRGEQARAILVNDLWIEARDTINKALLEKMGQYYDDPDACQIIALTKRIHDDYQEYFESIAESGQLADYQLSKE